MERFGFLVFLSFYIVIAIFSLYRVGKMTLTIQDQVCKQERRICDALAGHGECRISKECQ